MQIYTVVKKGWAGIFHEVSGVYTDPEQANQMAKKFKEELSGHQKREDTIWFVVLGPFDVETPERESI